MTAMGRTEPIAVGLSAARNGQSIGTSRLKII
jgi:hypothetical protein